MALFMRVLHLSQVELARPTRKHVRASTPNRLVGPASGLRLKAKHRIHLDRLDFARRPESSRNDT